MDEQQSLSWQYIVLIVATVALIFLVTTAAIPIERAASLPVPVSFSELALTARYEDAFSGISFDYPGNWQVTPLDAGRLVLTNYLAAIPTQAGSTPQLRPPVNPSDVLMGFFSATLENVGVEVGTTPEEFLRSLFAQTERAEAPIATQTIDDRLAARTHFVEGGYEREWIVIMPGESTMIFVEMNTLEGTWAEAGPFLERVLATMTIAEVAG